MPENKKLSASDPVGAATLGEFKKLEGARYEIGIQLLELEQDKVRLLATAHKLDEQRRRMFERILVERGMPPDSQIQVDSNSGLLTTLTPKSEG